MTQTATLDHVDYDVLDNAKNAFIAASRRTMRFAEKYGFIPDGRFGASANVFCLDLKPFLATGAENLFITLLPEGLGTADDARPSDLSEEELRRFWYNIGIKTVAVQTNDAASSGMQPILISLYLPSARPELVFDRSFMSGFLDGFVDGCKTVGCVYFSGETPQLKNKFIEDKLDIAGALFGLVPPGREPIDGSRLAAGQQIVFVESSGPHENGFTSLRELASRLPQGYRTKLSDGREYWEAVNAGSKLYTPLVQAILAAGLEPSIIEPISGHGWQKLMRSHKSLRYVIEDMLPVPEVFKFVEQHSGTTPAEMIKIFNYGVGMAIVIEGTEQASQIVKIAHSCGLLAKHVGYTETAASREVFVQKLGATLSSENFTLEK